MVLNGTIGARLHISFPVLNRSSFGFWLSYFTVISRIVLSMFWFGVQVCLSECSEGDFYLYHIAMQSFTGSEAVYQMLKAIWPSIAKIPNELPASSNITTAGGPIFLQDSTLCLQIPCRNDVLLLILDTPASPDVGLASEDQTFVHCERDNCSYCMGQHINLVVRKSPGQNQS